MICVMHATDCGGKCGDKEKYREDVLDDVAGDKDVKYRCSDAKQPAKENEVPEVAARYRAIDRQALIERCQAGVKEVLHGQILATSSYIPLDMLDWPL